MTQSLDNPHPHHATHVIVATAATAVSLTVAFHFLLAERWFGFGFALFFALLIVGVHVLVGVTGRQGNGWAYLFLIPALSGLVAETLYASMAVRNVAPLLEIASLSLFAYWYAGPRSTLSGVASFWPAAIVEESLFPFGRFGALFSGSRLGRSGTKIAFGIALSVPFLVLFGTLFASADPLFNKVLGGFLDARRFPEYLGKTVRDLIFLFFFLSAGATIVTRIVEGRRPKQGRAFEGFDRTVAATFLGALNALFLIFLAFQFAYFFGGEAVIRGYDIPYATYAREGFFQLLAVAGIVFAIVAALYRATEFRQWATRELGFLLMLQTGVVIASAVRRLLLYIGAYGLSVSRWWAFAVIALVAAIFLATFLAALARRTYGETAKAFCLSVLIVVGALLLVNVEGQVVRYDADRFLHGGSTRLDLNYLTGLSSDAVPDLVTLANAHWPAGQDGFGAGTVDWRGMTNPGDPRLELAIRLKAREPRLRETPAEEGEGADRRGWRDLVLSDYQALAALGTLRE